MLNVARPNSIVRLSIIACCCLAGRLTAAETQTLDPLIVEAERERVAAVDRAMPSTVSVFVPGGGGGGSGVLISPDGYALTNFHVSSPAGAHMRCGLSDGNIYDAVIVGIDPVGDLALIRLLGRDDFPAATLADSRNAQPGDWCMAIGNPFLLATNLQPTVTFGILSGVGRYQYPSGTLLEYADCLQTDAAINPGNSGGPLYNADGNLLGVIGRASFEKRGRVNVGVGYAISINQAKNFLGYLRSGRIVDHAVLGATVTTDPDGGVRVSNILESSDAYRRGLRYGAEILEIDGRPVETANEVQNVLATLPSEWRVKLSFRNDGKTTETLVRLGSLHRADELLEKMSAAMPPPPPRRMPEEKKDGQDQSPPHGLPRESGATENKMPDQVREQYVARKGYANYHFNQLQQSHFIDSLRHQFPADEQVAGASEALQAWSIEGQTDEPRPRPVQIQVARGELSMSIGDEQFTVQDKAERFELIEDQSDAALLPALDAWRRMLELGPEKFGLSHYLGRMPLRGERPLRDCLVGLDGELVIRWLNHPETTLVEAIEVFAGEDVDPAELWLIRDSDDPRAAPALLDLRFGTESRLRIRVSDWTSETVDELAGSEAGAEQPGTTQEQDQ